MPEDYRDPEDPPGVTKTRVVTCTGPNTPFSRPDGPNMIEFRDGTGTTLVIPYACG